jgi:hypothetical protein
MLIASQLITSCRDSGEVVIEYDMVLRRDVLRSWVEDKRDISRVVWGEANEDALAGLAVPLRNWFVVLELGVQNIDWITEDMRAR